jgi:hypothetical protein
MQSHHDAAQGRCGEEPAGDTLEPVRQELAQAGFSFARSHACRTALASFGLADWDGFAGSWHDLGLDTYMADGGRYRKRRFAAFAVSADGQATRKPHQPHYQSRDYNALNGGVQRWFEPMQAGVADHPAMQAVLAVCSRLFLPLAPAVEPPGDWHVEVHQFRIEASRGEAGRPTPEGMHQDGVDWVLVLLVQRHNVAHGETTIHDLQRRRIGDFTLAEPMDAAFVDDSRCFHGVTPVEPVEPTQPAFRDVLVVTYRRA